MSHDDSQNLDPDSLRQQVEDHLAEVLEGTASPELLERIAESDELRDLRFDAAQALDTAREAGADYQPPADLEQRLMAIVDGEVSAPAISSSGELSSESDGEQSPSTLRMDDPEAGVVRARRGDVGSGGTLLLGNETAVLGDSPAQPGNEGDTLPSADHEAHSGEASSAAITAPAPTTTASPARSEVHSREAARIEKGKKKSASGSQKEGTSRRSRWTLIVGGVGALAAAAAGTAYLSQGGPGSDPTATGSGWGGKLVVLDGPQGGLEVCSNEGSDCKPASAGQSLVGGARLKTSQTTRARLSLNDGTTMVLDRGTELQLSGTESRRAKLHRGALMADVAKKESKLARIDLPSGYAEVLGTKFALRASGPDSATVDVSRGRVKLVSADEKSVVIRAGEEGRLEKGLPPFASSAPALGEALAWGEEVGEQPDETAVVRGLGELRAKKPGEKDERAGAVKLTTHRVKTRIVGGMARTEVEEIFANQTDEVLEGIFRFPLPPDAQIERLALEVDGELKEGAFVDRDRAAAIWRGTIVNAAPKLRQQIKQEIIWVPGPWRDPALLEWQRGGRFELRIYPIPKRGSRRVVLTYTQTLKPTGGVRRYTYPLAHDPSGSTEVGQFELDVAVLGHDKRFAVQTQGYTLAKAESRGNSERFTLNQAGFRPSGDLVVEYAMPNREAEIEAVAYQPSQQDLEAAAKKRAARAALGKKSTKKTETAGGQVDESASYVAFSLRPKLPRVGEKTQRDFAVVVDASRSMFGEGYDRAVSLASRLVEELDEGDRVTVLACDTICQRMPGGLIPTGSSSAKQTRGFLSSVTPEGGSDVAIAVRQAQKALAGGAGRETRIVYIGDGTPTVGAIKANYVEKSIQRQLQGTTTRLTTVAVGSDADTDTLGAMARAGRGVVLPYVPGERTHKAVYAIIGASYGSALSDIQLELPAGLTAVAPTRLDPIPAGGETIVVARMNGASISGQVKLSGTLAGKPITREYPITINATSNAGNAYVPRLYAATRLGELERLPGTLAKTEAVELSQTFNVASKHTSLLVLESAAMFKAFGLDNTRAAPTWTGEEEAIGSTSADESAPGGGDFEESKDDFDGAARGSAGLGAGGLADLGAKGGSGSPRSESAPRPAAPSRRPPAKKSKPKAASPFDPLGQESQDWNRQRSQRRRPPRGRRMIPMRRVWDRVGTIGTSNQIPERATADKIAVAEREMQSSPNRRAAVKKLFQLLSVAGNTERARNVAEQWSQKDPLDPEALTARADVLARSGKREEAIRLLGSVIDVRPDDVKAQKRLARLQRWSGHPERGCRYSLAIAQIKSKDAKLLAEAVRCSRETGLSWMGDEMLSLAGKVSKRKVDTLLKRKTSEDKLSGDFRVEASWSGDAHDLDLALLHPDGDRASWLGAPTREVISATTVRSTRKEGLALRGAKVGEYLVEITRGSGSGPVSGSVKITVGKKVQTVPFILTGDRTTVALVKVRMQSRLVPARGGWGQPSWGGGGWRR